MPRVILEYQEEKDLAEKLGEAVRIVNERYPGLGCRMHKYTLILDGDQIPGAAGEIIDIAGAPYMAQGPRHLLSEALGRHGKRLTRRFIPYDPRRYVVDR